MLADIVVEVALAQDPLSVADPDQGLVLDHLPLGMAAVDGISIMAEALGAIMAVPAAEVKRVLAVVVVLQPPLSLLHLDVRVMNELHLHDPCREEEANAPLSLPPHLLFLLLLVLLLEMKNEMKNVN